MAERLSLKDYQRGLAERLREAGAGRMASKLGMQLGTETWLVDLGDAGEVIPVPAVTPVPLTRPWFKGVANVRGNLYCVIDFPAFLGSAAVAEGIEQQAELQALLLMGFDFGQGILVAPPMPQQRFLDLLRQRVSKPRPASAGAPEFAGSKPGTMDRVA